MCAVNTLQNLCAKLCVENKSILKHPVNISDIPLHIYEDLWNLTAIKDLEERKNYLNCRIDHLEDEWLDTDGLSNPDVFRSAFLLDINPSKNSVDCNTTRTIIPKITKDIFTGLFRAILDYSGLYKTIRTIQSYKRLY